MSHLSTKVVFLVAITSAKRVSELGPLILDTPPTLFHKDKISLHLHPKFLPKIISNFHLNQCIHLAVLFPNPRTSREEKRLQSLDVRHALAFYRQRTKLISSSHYFAHRLGLVSNTSILVH